MGWLAVTAHILFPIPSMWLLKRPLKMPKMMALNTLISPWTCLFHQDVFLMRKKKWHCLNSKLVEVSGHLLFCIFSCYVVTTSWQFSLRVWFETYGCCLVVTLRWFETQKLQLKSQSRGNAIFHFHRFDTTHYSIYYKYYNYSNIQVICLFFFMLLTHCSISES